MTTARELIDEELDGEDAIVFNGMDEAIVGWAQQFTGRPLVVYDRAKLIEILMRDGMDEEGADEYLEFNIAGLWAGEGTPLILHRRP